MLQQLHCARALNTGGLILGCVQPVQAADRTRA